MTSKVILGLTLTVASVQAKWSGLVHPKADPHPASQIYYPTKPKPPLKVEPLHHQLDTTYDVHHSYQPILRGPDYHSDPFHDFTSDPAHDPPPQDRHKHSAIIGGSSGETEGSYHVLLPDGRTQAVDFHVDDARSLVGTGFDASPLRSFRAVR